MWIETGNDGYKRMQDNLKEMLQFCPHLFTLMPFQTHDFLSFLQQKEKYGNEHDNNTIKVVRTRHELYSKPDMLCLRLLYLKRSREFLVNIDLHLGLAVQKKRRKNEWLQKT